VNNKKFLHHTLVFLQYCHILLKSLETTACGKTVLDLLSSEGRKVIIKPNGSNGNNVENASNLHACRHLALDLLGNRDAEVYFTEADGLVALARQQFQSNDDNVSLQRMADFMNSQPLYSLFQQPPYEFKSDGFLRRHKVISGKDLKDWFTLGKDSEFFTYLKTSPHMYQGVSIPQYIRCMAVVALESVLSPGKGVNTIIGLQCDNRASKRQRPSVLGLGHELIHAYWAGLGRQLGADLRLPSTLLFEMKCVGLGPWEDERIHPISENSLRAQMIEPLRTIYQTCANTAEARETMRKNYGTT
jgi:hypothetical protein